MKKTLNINKTTIQFLAATFTLALLASCAPKQSTNEVNVGSNQYGQKLLTNCNQASNSSFMASTAAVVNYNIVDTNSLKLKINFAAANIAKSGVTIKFFKWQVINNQANLDQTPLSFLQYDLTTQQPTTSWMTAIAGEALSVNKGFYIQLNDYSGSFQVIKIVAYDSSGQVLAQLNQLIPQFYASPTDYLLNADGSPRSATLQQLHPFYGTNKSATEAQAVLNQYCF